MLLYKLHAARQEIYGMSEHSALGASGCHRWWNCPGSVNASRDARRTTSDAAEEGTAAHKLAELCLTGGQDAAEYVGRRVHDRDVSPDMAEHVQTYLDHCRGILAGMPGGGGHLIEARFDLASLRPPAPMFGTADFVAWSHAWLWVVDLKFGVRNQVQAEGNPQLRYYTLGALLRLPPEAAAKIRYITVTIVQPRAPGGLAVRSTQISPMDLAEWSLELFDRAAATLAPDAPRVAGEWCQFCPAAGPCSEQARSALAVAQAEFGAAPPELRSMTPEQVGQALQQAPQLEAWIKALRAAAAAEIRAGRAIPGWKLVQGKAVRGWASPETLAADLADHGIPATLVNAPPEVRSPAQLEAAVAAEMAPVYSSRKASLAAAKALLAPFQAFSIPGVRLAPGADPSPAIPAGGAEFPLLTQEEAP